jgi:hypothetical protein
MLGKRHCFKWVKVMIIALFGVLIFTSFAYPESGSSGDFYYLANKLLKENRFDDLSLLSHYLTDAEKSRLYNSNRKIVGTGFANILVPGLGDLILGNYGWGVFNMLGVYLGWAPMLYFMFYLPATPAPLLISTVGYLAIYIWNIASPFVYASRYNRELSDALRVQASHTEPKFYAEFNNRPELQIPLLALKF